MGAEGELRQGIEANFTFSTQYGTTTKVGDMHQYQGTHSLENLEKEPQNLGKRSFSPGQSCMGGILVDILSPQNNTHANNGVLKKRLNGSER